MRTYALFGLTLSSELSFPELARQGEAAADVLLAKKSLEPPRPSDFARPNWFAAVGEVAWFDWSGVAAVRIERGQIIEVDPQDGVDPAGLRSAILGPVFTVLLAQRGMLPLHASAVAIEGKALAFAGGSGAGKSTLALSLLERGHEFLADDVAALDLTGESIAVLPGFPQLKLEPELLEHRGERWEDLPSANPVDGKRLRRVPGLMRRSGVKLDRIYVLEDGEEGIVHGPLLKRDAFLQAMRHGHRAALLERVLGVPELMRRCSALAEAVPFYRVTRPRVLERLGSLVQRIEEHARA